MLVCLTCSRNTEKFILDVGLGLIVELSPEEAQKFVPERVRLLEDRISNVEKEIQSIESLRLQFHTQYEMLQNVNSGMQNLGAGINA